jgi:hypothetical protein
VVGKLALDKLVRSMPAQSKLELLQREEPMAELLRGEQHKAELPQQERRRTELPQEERPRIAMKMKKKGPLALRKTKINQKRWWRMKKGCTGRRSLEKSCKLGWTRLGGVLQTERGLM